MKRHMITEPAFGLVGLSVCTTNAAEMNPNTAKISGLIQRYHTEKTAEHIPHRASPGVFYSVYTHYEGGVDDPYTYFVGEAVTSFADTPAGLEKCSIPAQTYQKFTCGPGPMPHACIQAWQAIWAMQPSDLGGERAFLADFERYDTRSQDPEACVFDILIGLKP